MHIYIYIYMCITPAVECIERGAVTLQFALVFNANNREIAFQSSFYFDLNNMLFRFV